MRSPTNSVSTVRGTYAIAFLLLTLLVLPVEAQTTRLTLQDAIALAQAQSPAAAVARLQYAEADWTYRAFVATFRPSISLTGNAPGLQRSIADVVQDDGSIRYVEQSRWQSSANLRVSQVVSQTGGQVFVQSGLSRIEQFGNFDFGEWQASPLVIGVQQPILQFNAQKWNRRLEAVRYEASHKAFAEAMEGVAVDIAGQFFEVYIAQMTLDLETLNVAVNDTIYTLSEGRFEIGRIAENDLLQSELALLNAQTSLADARIAYDRAVQNLKLALGLPYNADLDVIPPTTIVALAIDPERAVAEARRNRSAFDNLVLQEQTAARNVAQARRANSFSATLNASFGLNQSAPDLSDAFQNPLNQQALSVGFQVPLYQWGRSRAELNAAEAGFEEAMRTTTLRRDELDQEVYFEALALQQQQQQVQIAAKADTVAARRFAVARGRYGVGNIDVTDLFDAQREKDGARRAYIQSLRTYWVSLFRLRRLTLFDFATGQRITHSLRAR